MLFARAFHGARFTLSSALRPPVTMNTRLCCLRTPRVHRPVTCKASSARFLVGGNWKCNGSIDSVKTLVAELNAGDVPDIDIVCAPTFVHLHMVSQSLKSPFQLSAQDCWTQGGGAYTGEISADMLADMGIPWVITGHSERRALCGESSDMVGVKSAYAISKGLKVIACIGESLEQREKGDLWDVLTEQMAALKEHVAPQDWDKLVIAYEPVWAIGTGVVASPAQAQEVHAWLRDWVMNNMSRSIADRLRLLYGGSVKGSNCGELASQEDIDGFLVGGASLNGKEFITICNAQSLAASAA